MRYLLRSWPYKLLCLWLLTATLGYLFAWLGFEDNFLTWGEYPCSIGEYRIKCIQNALMFSAFQVVVASPILIIGLYLASKIKGSVAYVIAAATGLVSMLFPLVAVHYDSPNLTRVLSLYPNFIVWIILACLHLYTVKKRDRST